MKKFILIFVTMIFVSFVFYFFIHNTKTKQVRNDTSIEALAENLKKRTKNAEDAVAFMKNKKCDLMLLNSAYEELGKIYKLDKRYSDSEKSYREIIKIMNKNLKLRENTEYLKQEIDAYCEIGDLCLYQKDKDKALEAFNEASKLIKKKTVPEFSQWYVAIAYTKIANGYFELEKGIEAEKLYKEALTLLSLQKEKDYRMFSFLYYKIGRIAFINKDWQKSVSCLEKAWFSTQKYKADIDSIISISSELSNSYYMTKEFKKGLNVALTAYKEQKNKYGNNVTTGLYATMVGTLYDKLKQKNKALEFLQISHKIFAGSKTTKSSNAADRILKRIKKLQKNK